MSYNFSSFMVTKFNLWSWAWWHIFGVGRLSWPFLFRGQCLFYFVSNRWSVNLETSLWPQIFDVSHHYFWLVQAVVTTSHCVTKITCLIIEFFFCWPGFYVYRSFLLQQYLQFNCMYYLSLPYQDGPGCLSVKKYEEI